MKVRGRPPSQASHEAILEAALHILADRGYAGMTFDAVAARANAGRSTIYRWWPTKAALAVSAFFHGTRNSLHLPETGSTREDFRLQIVQLVELLRGPRGAVFAAMLGGSRTDPDLAREMGDRWLEPRRAWGMARMLGAIEKGECHSDVDARAALGLLYGPLYAPLLFGQDFPSPDEVKAHLELALPAIFIR